MSGAHVVVIAPEELEALIRQAVDGAMAEREADPAPALLDSYFL